MRKDSLEQTAIYFGVFLLVLLLFVFTAYSFQNDTVEPEAVSGDRYGTNLSATGFEVIDISNASGGIKQGSLVVYDAKTGAELATPGNYSVVSYQEGTINVTRFHDDDPAVHRIGVSFTAYVTDTSAVRIVRPLLDLIELLVGLVVPIGVGVVAIFGLGYLGKQLLGR
ncbi:MAG: hypothetical protein SVW02_00695 [Candidatus Nanohaloarchaea archaeon]|nr:hypothetical protein [Candidatus Nanohaloarchaea archaeon]